MKVFNQRGVHMCASGAHARCRGVLPAFRTVTWERARGNSFLTTDNSKETCVFRTSRDGGMVCSPDCWDYWFDCRTGFTAIVRLAGIVLVVRRRGTGVTAAVRLALLTTRNLKPKGLRAPSPFSFTHLQIHHSLHPRERLCATDPLSGRVIVVGGCAIVFVVSRFLIFGVRDCGVWMEAAGRTEGNSDSEESGMIDTWTWRLREEASCVLVCFSGVCFGAKVFPLSLFCKRAEEQRRALIFQKASISFQFDSKKIDAL